VTMFASHRNTHSRGGRPGGSRAARDATATDGI